MLQRFLKWALTRLLNELLEKLNTWIDTWQKNARKRILSMQPDKMAQQFDREIDRLQRELKNQIESWI